MNTVYRLLVALSLAVLSQTVAAGAPQCDWIGNPLHRDACYIRETNVLKGRVHVFYGGGFWMPETAPRAERYYASFNNGIKLYADSRCAGDLRCEYDLYAAEYQRTEAKLRAHQAGQINLYKEFKANMAAGRRPVFTGTTLPKLTKADYMEQPKPPTESLFVKKEPEPFRCVLIDGTVYAFDVYDQPRGEVIWKTKPTSKNHLAVAEVTNDGWALLVAATWDSDHSKFPNGTVAGWAKEAELRYSDTGCDKVYEVVH